MRNPLKLLGSIAVSAVFLTASPAWADHQGVPVYHTTMYTDATRTTVAGAIFFEYCTYYSQSDGVKYGLAGTYTYHQENELVGYCSQGELLLVH